jgi:hypothetical protein
MIVIPWDAAVHLPIVNEWMRLRGQGTVREAWLSPVGCVACLYSGVPVATMALYLCGSGVRAFTDDLYTNPTVSKRDIGRGINSVINGCIDLARSVGVRYVCGFTNHKRSLSKLTEAYSPGLEVAGNARQFMVDLSKATQLAADHPLIAR